MALTLEQLRAICPQTGIGKLAVFVEPLNAAFEEFGIGDGLEVAHFFAQAGQETGGFNWLKEFASGADYDHRADLGNTVPEAIAIAARHGTTPGRFWKGHGVFQTTGYKNHLRVAEKLGIDCVENPELLCEPIGGARAAGLYWRDNALSALAQRDDLVGITKRVNGAATEGPPSHLAERRKYLERAKLALGIA